MTTHTATWGAERPRSNGLFSATLEALSRARSKRKTAAALADLEDHVLVDIGFDPSQVRRRERSTLDWVVHSHSGTARLVFIGR